MTYYESPVLSDWQKQIIMGTVLGGSSIVKPAKGRNCYLFMRSRNRYWVMYKAEELRDFASQRPFTDEASTLRWHSNCYPVFNELRELFYKDEKKIITMDILDQLKDIALAVWYGDCGKMKKGRVILNTNKFGEEGNELMLQYFNEVGMECEGMLERKRMRLQFTQNGTMEFLKIASHRLPDFMHGKISL